MPQRPSGGKRVFTDIAPPKKVVATQIFKEPAPRIQRPERPVMRPREKRRFPKKILGWGLLTLFVMGGAALWSIGHARMSIVVTPKHVDAQLDALIPVARGSEDHPLRLIADSVTKQGTFRGNVSKASVQEKARGSIVIFNKATEAPQALVANTRFMAPDGKIYRIPEAVTVPGYKKDGAKIIPGSKEVVVVADKAGVEYNIGLVDFTIPGFQGSPKYKTIIARSKTEMTGGFSGERPVVNPDDVEKATLKLKAESEEKAYSMLQAKADPGSIIVKPTVQFVVTDIKTDIPPGSTDGTFTISLSGEARGAFVSEDDVIRSLPKTIAIPGPLHVTNMSNLSYTFDGYAYDAQQATLRISGTASAESVVDTATIKKAVLTGKLAKSADILRNFAQLAEVTVQFRPFWFRYVPLDESRIDIATAVR